MLRADGGIVKASPCRLMVKVGAPALHPHFGDKEGLLSAVVDHGFEQYLVTERERGETTDAVEVLRRGWDSHVAFALDNRTSTG